MTTSHAEMQGLSAESPVRSRIGPDVEEVGLRLEEIAYENNHLVAFHAWLDSDDLTRRAALLNKYVLYSVLSCAGERVSELSRVSRHEANEFVQTMMNLLLELRADPVAGSEEWFRGIELLSGSFANLNYVQESRTLVALALRSGAMKFPRVALALQVQGAYLDALIGRKDKAARTALAIVNRPYLLPNPRELPRLYLKLMYILASSNHLAEYRRILWAGASSFHATDSLRAQLARQLVLTYRGAWRALIQRDADCAYRLAFLIGNLHRLATDWPLLRKFGVPALTGSLHRAFLYLLHRLGAMKPIVGPGPKPTLRQRVGRAFSVRRLRSAVVTRAMGGIGDLLMMTPGLRALAARQIDGKVYFAIPKGFHPIFQNLEYLRLIDINAEQVDVKAHRRWVNLTDCPAGRVEGRQYPNVRRNRIEIFARAMGVGHWRIQRHGGYLPDYRVGDAERLEAERRLALLNPRGLPVVGVQPFAADSYRNWPHMDSLVQQLATDSLVLVFHNEALTGFDHANVVKIVAPIRESIALLSCCDRLVALDSSFLHFSAALRLPTVAIFGAISGRLRTRRYSNVRLIAPDKRQFPCYPCWRHEYKPCHLTNGRESICLRSITPDRVFDAMKAPTLPKPPSLLQRATAWMLYGRD